MSSTTIYELIGYAGSILIVISLAMSTAIRLRIVNLVGSIVFMVYGGLIASIPVVITNVIIAGLDMYYLRRELTTRSDLGIVSVDADDPFLSTFLERHGDDMATYGSVDPSAADLRFVMLRDTTLAGVFLGRDLGGGELEVLLDYVAPSFRDLRSGAALYHDDGARFTSLGYRKLVVDDPDDRQRGYLAEMGYVVDRDAMVMRVG